MKEYERGGICCFKKASIYEMNKLYPIFFICMILAAFYEKNSIYDRRNSQYIFRDKFFYIIIVLVLVGFSGLRIRYNDTATYIQAYQQLVIGNTNIVWSIGDNPGFQLVNLLLKNLGISANGFIMCYSLTTVGIYLWFIRKYSCNFSLSLFIMLTSGVYIFSMAAIKQCIAIAIGLLGVDAAIERKWIKFVVVILIAMLFHTYALMFAITPLLIFRPWTKKSYILICGTLLAGILFQTVLSGLLSVASLFGENYDPALLNGEGVNAFRLLVAIAPMALSFFVRDQLKREQNGVESLMINLMCVNAALMFMSLFGTAFYLARVANYFAIFSVIAIPYILQHFELNIRRILTAIVIIGFCGFAVYAYGINRGFDMMYDSITIGQFFKTLFV